MSQIVKGKVFPGQSSKTLTSGLRVRSFITRGGRAARQSRAGGCGSRVIKEVATIKEGSTGTDGPTAELTTSQPAHLHCEDAQAYTEFAIFYAFEGFFQDKQFYLKTERM